MAWIETEASDSGDWRQQSPPLAAVAFISFDYWSPFPCTTGNCVEAHQHFAAHENDAMTDEFVYIMQPAEVLDNPRRTHGLFVQDQKLLDKTRN